MGSFNAHNGTWGVFTDVVYLNLGGDKQRSRDFTLGNMGIQASTTAGLGWDLKGLVWTLAGQYRLVSSPEHTLDALAGARLFDLEQSLRWSISGDLGPVDPSGRTGSSKIEDAVVDGIVGVKGRAALGTGRDWSVPYYLDIGTGQSDVTWQVAAGVSYAFKWGEVSALWRYLSYDFDGDKGLKGLRFSGPQIGATVRW
jgi:hypothetical protein